MKAYRTYAIYPRLPENLEPLREIAYNLCWAWNPDAIELLRRLDRTLWETTRHNPVAMLGMLSQERLEELARDESFLEHLDRVHKTVQRYLEDETWWARRFPQAKDQAIAYFGLEFGLSECLPIYSGGMGVLAGDHFKSASDLGVPVYGVGLLYQEGYFRQYLSADGWQQEDYPDNDFSTLPVRPASDGRGEQVQIVVPIGPRDVAANIWQITVGRRTLFMLDTNVEGNAPEDRAITSALYGGDQTMRLRQEILLGIGGIEALSKLGISPAVYHMNEGHSAFLALERIRRLMKSANLSFEEAREAAAVGNVFTTHTPVPAGHDRFDPELMDAYFKDYYPQLGLSRDQFLALGRVNPSDPHEPFCMTVLALKLSAWRNAVSRLHGVVTRKMWRDLWPDVPEEEIPIVHITNGVHTTSWLSGEMLTLFDRYLGTRWREYPEDETVFRRIDDIPDTELWGTHERRRERLVAYARRRLREQLIRRGATQQEIAQAEEVLHPEALTIGFGRRFATYKRATLLLRDEERLVRLLTDKERPIQLIFAGKAHPADRPGKEMIRQLIHFARRPELRHRVVFLEDYDMSLCRYMVQGVDVWLNTPRRPLEASGTSGMKATANGALNLSVLDGWWDEAYVPQETGWAIGSGEVYADENYQDEVESRALYDVLEKEIIPLFYTRGADQLPRQWIALMKRAMKAIVPQFSSHRMVREYSERFYRPGMKRWEELSADNFARARALAAWKARVRDAWGGVKIVAISDRFDGGEQVGGQLTVSATVELGALSPDDVRVELCYGRVNPEGDIISARAEPMECTSHEGSKCEFGISITCEDAGTHGYTVRVLPAHEDLVSLFDTGLILWAHK